MELRSLVAEKYGQTEKCPGHCESPATLKILNDDGDTIIAGYSCPSAYLSRIMIYSRTLDLPRSRDTIARVVGEETEVKDEDVRIASRYPWDLELASGDGEKLLMVAYWTQNYRRTKNDDPNRRALFLCQRCQKTFSQPLGEKQLMCSACRS
jgi:hypothetical protein